MEELSGLGHHVQKTIHHIRSDIGTGLVKNDPFSHCHRCVWHDADDGILLSSHLLDLGDGKPCRHGDQDGGGFPRSQRGADSLQHTAH